MPKLPRLSSDKLIKILLKLGFYIHHQRGSHINLRNIYKSHLHVVIPTNRKELAPKTFKSILTQAEITLREIKDYL